MELSQNPSKPKTSMSAEYHCEACGDPLTREEYVAVGPSTPAARHLNIDDNTRDHLVVCDDCFEGAAEEIGTDRDNTNSDR